ncbi:hypothetical protein CLV36_101314 [Laceyella sediminis]|uniref:Uncharacterized protein n=1 Tax=Laceyella sediminis TaxID=573074 RepID=A0ABX5ETB2_9BACL|nr:hypothetical protein CLV36_101314 [Laceyella sediminis]
MFLTHYNTYWKTTGKGLFFYIYSVDCWLSIYCYRKWG